MNFDLILVVSSIQSQELQNDGNFQIIIAIEASPIVIWTAMKKSAENSMIH